MRLKKCTGLSGDITRDNGHRPLRNYLLYELKVTELTPELVLPAAQQGSFLEDQPQRMDSQALRVSWAVNRALVRQGAGQQHSLGPG